MDIEKLTKSQIVLLTLLISFVTSIATGIVTVSLMQQAPPAVAETVNRVIENTVETVATSTRGQTAASVVTQQKTVVVNEADLISQAVQQITPSIVRVYSGDQTQYFGIGVVIDASGTVATDLNALSGAENATIELSNGTMVQAAVDSRDQGSGLVYLAPASTTATSVSWTPAPIAASDPSLGDVVVAIAGENNMRIAQGLVTEIVPADKGAGVPETIDTNLDQSSIQDGSVIIDTNGDVVGVSTGVSRASSPSGFVPASVLSATNDPN